MELNVEVKRHRLSVTQGEVEVLINGKSIVRYGDDIVLGGKYDCVDGWGSNLPDNYFVESALKQYLYEDVSA